MSVIYAKWDGTCGPISGSTNFGFYDNEAEFQDAGPKVANFCARKLGYPIVEIEMSSGSFFTCFEEAITEYSAQVNQFNIKDNLLSARGVSTDTNLTHKNISNSLGSILRLADDYGNAMGLYSSVNFHTGSIAITAGKQTYTLNPEAGRAVTITRVHHYAPPALARYFDPYAGTGAYSMMEGFGFDKMSPATSFLMMPIYEDLLRLQAIEFNDIVRKSSYGFNLYNDTLQIFPLPRNNFTLWYEYFINDERDAIASTYDRSDGSNSMSDFSNVTYNNMPYADINDPGKQWIRNYTLALCKELLGHIRRKYSTIPIPGSELTLDGEALISDAQSEKEALITQLREILEQTSKQALMEAKASEAESLTNVLKYTPSKIYIA